MCGIVGYIGSKEAYPVLIKGLHRLEYRGYDSSGVAMISDEGKLNIYKAKGKVAALEHFAESKDRSGTVGIAHTRWATHGEPNDTNAHPHASQSAIWPSYTTGRSRTIRWSRRRSNSTATRSAARPIRRWSSS